MLSIEKNSKSFHSLRAALFGLLLTASCVHQRASFRIPERAPDAWIPMEVTGYCDCGDCCGWERNLFGRAVHAYGSRKGQRKQVGITASGTRARHGTAAADTRLYPFGTILYVEGYGYARVEDRGGAIKGQRLDLFYTSHNAALQWGRRHRNVAVWYPRRR